MGPTTDSQHVILASTETGVEASSPLQLQLQLQAPPPVESKSNPDIEHAPVEDDPRTWTNARKTTILLIISGASMLAGLSVSIQNPANAQIEQQLHATSGQVSLTLSLFILVQGNFPLLWSAMSEIKGRKLVYLLSLSLFTLGSAIVAVSKSIGLVIGMRVLQGIGSSAVLAIGAATLADMYEPHERGTIVGIYYCAPLLGPSLGPILGGVLTQALSWRAIFWFLVICGGVILSAFLFLFKDTFRKERSSAYQNVLKKRAPKHQVCETKWTTSGEPSSDEGAIRQTREDIEASAPVVTAEIVKDVKLTFVDMNPFPPYGKVLDRKNNVAVLVSSGLLFAFCYSITYTCARTLATQYDFDALMTGLVLLSYGIGTMFGSILGGWWSDWTLARLISDNNGNGFPEMRLESTKLAMWWLPPSVIGYAWVCQQHVHISAMCVMLFLNGFFVTWIYSSTLVYIVDSNTGRSSTAVAANSSFRGTAAFVAMEIAVPLQDAIGDGGLYTIWAGLVLFTQLMILLVIRKGRQWREAAVDKGPSMERT